MGWVILVAALGAVSAAAACILAAAAGFGVGRDYPPAQVRRALGAALLLLLCSAAAKVLFAALHWGIVL